MGRGGKRSARRQGTGDGQGGDDATGSLEGAWSSWAGVAISFPFRRWS